MSFLRDGGDKERKREGCVNKVQAQWNNARVIYLKGPSR